MLLLDKGYYDYDYQQVEKPVVWEDTIKSDEEVSDMLAMFGLRPKTKKDPETTEEIQEYIIKQESYGS